MVSVASYTHVSLSKFIDISCRTCQENKKSSSTLVAIPGIGMKIVWVYILQVQHDKTRLRW